MTVIAACQLALTVGEVDANRAATAATVAQAAADADRCRAERGVSWVGGTVIVGPDGYPLAGPVAGDQEAALTAPCDLARARDKKISERNDVLADRRPPLYRAVAG